MSEYLQTPSQTVGPFFGFALPFAGGGELVGRENPSAIRLHGTLFDGDGEAVPDAVIELWQPDEFGRISTEKGSRERDGYAFTGFGRVGTSRAGGYSFTTVLPGAVGEHPPYVLITVFARGLLHHLFTRAYFGASAGEDGAVSAENADWEARVAADSLLSAVPAERRSTLFALADGPGSYRFDIRLQGDGETVFFDFDA